MFGDASSQEYKVMPSVTATCCTFRRFPVRIGQVDAAGALIHKAGSLTAQGLLNGPLHPAEQILVPFIH
jgi:hypothetical protein